MCDYIKPKRTEFDGRCPLCKGKIQMAITPNDPLGQVYICPNPNCCAENVDPHFGIYSCTLCEAETTIFSDIDGLPYCIKHLPVKEGVLKQ